MDGGHTTKVGLFNEGGDNVMNIKYTFVSTDGSKCEVVQVSTDLLKNASLTADGFEQAFFTEARTSSTYMEAYEKVEVFHEELFGKRKYSDYNSFRNSKTQRNKNDHSR